MSWSAVTTRASIKARNCPFGTKTYLHWTDATTQEPTLYAWDVTGEAQTLKATYSFTLEDDNWGEMVDCVAWDNYTIFVSYVKRGEDGIDHPMWRLMSPTGAFQTSHAWEPGSVFWVDANHVAVYRQVRNVDGRGVLESAVESLSLLNVVNGSLVWNREWPSWAGAPTHYVSANVFLASPGYKPYTQVLKWDGDEFVHHSYLKTDNISNFNGDHIYRGKYVVAYRSKFTEIAQPALLYRKATIGPSLSSWDSRHVVMYYRRAADSEVPYGWTVTSSLSGWKNAWMIGSLFTNEDAIS